MSARPTAATFVAGLLAVALAVSLGAAPLSPAGAGGTTATCAGETATMVGTDHADVLTGTSGRDVVDAGGGADTVRGLGGEDLMCGGDGPDVLRGGAGDDTLVDTVGRRRAQALHGGDGDDALVVAWQAREDGEVVVAGLEVDLAERRARVGGGRWFPVSSFRSVRGAFNVGTWSVAGTGADEVFATHQYVAVEIRGRGGDDVLRGSWHDDLLRGGPGHDEVHADRGRDACVSVEEGPLEECESAS